MIALAATIPWGLVAGTPIVVLFAIPLIPLAVTVAIVRHRLLDIRLIVSRALSWLLLSLAVVVAYAALLALWTAWCRTRSAGPRGPPWCWRSWPPRCSRGCSGWWIGPCTATGATPRRWSPRSECS